MSTPASLRVGRSYTRARRHPWVLGKIGDFTLPLGPYTPAQLAIAAAGTFLLIKTFSLWSPLGPVPVVALGFAVWAARATSIGGRSPLWAAYGWVQFALQPHGGRIGGRTVRDPKVSRLHGSFLIEDTTAPASLPAAAAPLARPARSFAPGPRRGRNIRGAQGLSTRPPWGRRRSGTRRPAPRPRPAPTALQQMLRERQEAHR
ncbi:hypothetical protein EOT10_39840 [Streptomyces antnestii]|uniref:Uncharacterized protein n=1 Tax=Streptomyces antnestii TaxID=2494256 RepID=A0A3S3U440_9ACTN|nr:hypothetical protein [Streptomyces sp. San01]RVU15133.1 hypothetical protein EOT10_39840 [Streptomyces sp. San01]